MLVLGDREKEKLDKVDRTTGDKQRGGTMLERWMNT